MFAPVELHYARDGSGMDWSMHKASLTESHGSEHSLNDNADQLIAICMETC